MLFLFSLTCPSGRGQMDVVSDKKISASFFDYFSKAS